MPRGFKRDHIATAARGFLDKKSFISAWPNPGHEILWGKDWEARKVELLAMAGDRCERVIQGVRCEGDANDPHHLDNKTGRRCDCRHNLIALCRAHHNAIPQHAKRKPMWTKREKP
jgi:hypothetical protein